MSFAIADYARVISVDLSVKILYLAFLGFYVMFVKQSVYRKTLTVQYAI